MIFPQPIAPVDSYEHALSITTLRAWTRTSAEEFSDEELLELGLGALLLVEAKSRVIPQPRKYTAKFSDFCDYDIRLFPFTSIENIKYYDVNNAEQTLAQPGNYTVESRSQHNNRLVYTATTLPTLYDRWDAVTVTFNAGYTPELLPANVKQAIRHTVMHWYNNPDSPKQESPSLVDDLIKTFAIDVFA